MERRGHAGNQTMKMFPCRFHVVDEKNLDRRRSSRAYYESCVWIGFHVTRFRQIPETRNAQNLKCLFFSVYVASRETQVILKLIIHRKDKSTSWLGPREGSG